MALTASIIIPSNRTTFVDETILSIAKQIVRPKEVVMLYDIHNTVEANADKINRGASMISADTFVVLGDDDMLHPEFLEKTLAKMEETGCDLVSTAMEQIGLEPGIHRTVMNLDRMKEHFGLFYTTLIRKSLWEKVGGYDAFCGPFSDWDFWWRCAEVGAKVEYLLEPLFIYRRHDKQDSQTLTDEMCKWSREYILEKHRRIKERPQRNK